MKNSPSLPQRVDYDASDCDYIQYWQGRQYEDEAEKIALRRFLPQQGGIIADLGAGFGRLLPLYAERFTKIILLDLSEKNLSQARLLAENLGLSQVEIKKGDLYQLPLKTAAIDWAVMVRVMHHLEAPERVLQEVARILRPGGYFILETANKCHFKARLRAWWRGEKNFSSSLEPYRQPAAGKEGIFYNFHPRAVEEMLRRCQLLPQAKLSVSNWRSPWIKKLFPRFILLSTERFFQPLLARINFGPSLFWLCQKNDS